MPRRIFFAKVRNFLEKINNFLIFFAKMIKITLGGNEK
jgi:hypothetical protein